MRFLYTSEFRIEELKRNTAYTAVVSHSLDGTDYSAQTTTLSIPEYDETKQAAIGFSISDDVLMADNIEGNSVTLYKKINLNDSDDKAVAVKNDISVSDGSVRIESSSLPSLESGYFYFASDTAFSNVIEYTVPVTVKRITNNWKSADLEIDFASDASTAFSSLTVSGGGRNASAKYTDSGVRIENLDSNTSYPAVTLSFRPDSGLNSESVIVELETQSFSGTYEWTGNLVDGDRNTNFKVVVTDQKAGTDTYPAVPETSIYPYYVYFDSDPESGDKSIIGQGLANQSLRILPLVDSSAGENGATAASQVNMDNPGELRKQNEAYKANNKKWNASPFSPSRWYIDIADNEPDERDIIETVTQSFAIILTAPTTTTFEFMEAELSEKTLPVVKFKNTSSSSLVRNYLRKNSADQRSAYGDEDEADWQYCWYLEKVSD